MVLILAPGYNKLPLHLFNGKRGMGETSLFDTSYIDTYEKYLTEDRHAPVNTISSYIRDIKKFADYLETAEKHDFEGISEEDVRVFLSQLEKAGRSPATVSRCVASLKAFFSRLIAQELIGINQVIGISRTNSGKKPPRILTGEEIDRLLEQPDDRDLKGCRDKAILEILYATGIRVSELISLDEADVNLSTGLITCRNGKERIIPVYNAAVNAISHYLTFGRPVLALSDEQALFVNAKGMRLTRQGCWKILKGYTTSAQIEDDITPQMLRNSFAAHLLENGADLRSLQEMLGHADISSTQVYARAVKNNLKDVYNKAHPRSMGQKSRH